MVPHHSRGIEIAEKGPTDYMVVKRLVPFLWPQGEWTLRARLVVAFVCIVFAKAATVTLPFLVGLTVNALSVENAAIIVVPIALILGYGLLRTIGLAFTQLQDALISRVVERAVRQIQVRLFSHIQQLGLQFHLDRQTGAISRTIERGARAIDMLLTLVVLRTLPAILEFVFVCTLQWVKYGWLYSLVTFISTAAYVTYTISITDWRLKFRRKMNQSDGDAHTKLIDALINYETVKYFGNEANEVDRVDSALHAYENAAVNSKVSLALLNIGQGAIIAAGLTGIMLLAATDVKAGLIGPGDFVALFLWNMQLFVPLSFLGMLYREVKQSLVDLELVFNLFDRPPEIADVEDAIVLRHVHGTMEFDHVSFAYNPARQILKDVSFTVNPGERVAIVGPTGSGKSTIVRLLFRFFDVTDGSIKIDGHDIRNVSQQSMRSAIGIVPQDTVLFNDTIYHNIAYGKLDASEEEVMAAADHAHLTDFIKKLPDGYKTKVGERGLKLSGGEKQRVGIARTILKGPKIMVFDEATSSLDMITEKAIQSSMREVSEGRATIIIAHRLSTITDADRIIVLDEGCVVETGSHMDLLKHQGVYAKLWEAQKREASKGQFSPPKAEPVPEVVS